MAWSVSWGLGRPLKPFGLFSKVNALEFLAAEHLKRATTINYQWNANMLHVPVLTFACIPEILPGKKCLCNAKELKRQIWMYTSLCTAPQYFKLCIVLDQNSDLLLNAFRFPVCWRWRCRAGCRCCIIFPLHHILSFFALFSRLSISIVQLLP